MAGIIYQINNLTIESEISLLGITPRLRDSKKPDIKIKEISEMPRRGQKLHRFLGAECFQNANRYYVYFRGKRSSFEKSGILTHYVLPHILASQGFFLFHGSIIKNKNKTFLVLGKSGSGKSTLSLAAMKRNGSCFGDEASILYNENDNWYVQSAFSTLRVWPKQPSEKKRIVILEPQKNRQRLNRVIILKKKARNAKLKIHEGSGLLSFRELMTHLFWPENLSAEKRKKLFQQLSSLTNSLAPVIVDYPHRPANQTLVLRELLEFKKIG